MTQQGRIWTISLSAAALGMFIAVAFLLPKGASLPYLGLQITLGLLAAALVAYAYARTQTVGAEPRDFSLRPEVEWHVIQSDLVPASLMQGQEPLVALIADGQLPHPEFVSTLSSYFADPSLGFVQAATRFDGSGRVADAFRLLTNIADEAQRAAGTAVALRGSGAMFARDAAKAAYRPGDTWVSLGMRMEALGYAGRFEQESMVLSWAPATLAQYRAVLLAQSRTMLRGALGALLTRGLPLDARLQYLGRSAASAAAWTATLTVVLSISTLLLFGAGPVIMTSPAALPGVLLLLLCAGTTYWAFRKLTGLAPLRAVALSVAGVGSQAGVWTYQAATSPELKRAWRAVADATRAIVPKGGSANTAPAGTPARL